METEGKTEDRPEGIDLLDLLALIAENIRLLAFGPIAVGLVALGIAFLIPPTFSATTRILPPQQQRGAAAMLAAQLGAFAGLAGAAGFNVRNPLDTYVALLKSRTVADRIIDRFGLQKVYGSEFRQGARKALASATKISTAKYGLITIEVSDEEPQRAADLANAYVQELLGLTGALAITEAQSRRMFFEKQLQRSRENLKKAETALAQTGAGERLLKSVPHAVVAGIARLKAQVTTQEIRIATMREYLTEANPEFLLARRQLASLRAQLEQEERNQPTGSDAGEDYVNRFRDFKYQETLFELIAKQHEMAKLDEAREGALVQVVDAAVVPERRSAPRRTLIAVAAAVSAGLGVLVFMLLREAFRNTLFASESMNKLAGIRTALRRATGI